MTAWFRFPLPCSRQVCPSPGYLTIPRLLTVCFLCTGVYDCRSASPGSCYPLSLAVVWGSLAADNLQRSLNVAHLGSVPVAGTSTLPLNGRDTVNSARLSPSPHNPGQLATRRPPRVSLAMTPQHSRSTASALWHKTGRIDYTFVVELCKSSPSIPGGGFIRRLSRTGDACSGCIFWGSGVLGC
jgi:hypothetical protein